LAATRLTAHEGVLDPDGIYLADRAGLWSVAEGAAKGKFLVRITPVPSGGESYYDYAETVDLFVDMEGNLAERISPMPRSFIALAGDGKSFLTAGQREGAVHVALVDEDKPDENRSEPLFERVSEQAWTGLGRREGGFVFAWAEGYSAVKMVQLGDLDSLGPSTEF
jgi:hypothetical protein